MESSDKVAGILQDKVGLTLKETTGNHKKWREVKAGSKAKWPMYGKSAATTKRRGKKP